MCSIVNALDGSRSMHDEWFAQGADTQLLTDDTLGDVNDPSRMLVHKLETDSITTIAVYGEPETSIDASSVAATFSVYKGTDDIVVRS